MTSYSSIDEVTQFENPQFSVDNVLFTVHESTLKILLIKRSARLNDVNYPYPNRWALPGGFIDLRHDENTEMTALRKLKEKTGITPAYLEQLEVFSGISRDPRGFSVTLIYYALTAFTDVESSIETASEACWIDISNIDNLPIAFDHKNIIDAALTRLHHKAISSMAPIYCLPAEFTIGQLKIVIETIIGKKIQRKSLMRRVDDSGMFEKINEKAVSGGRSATVYKRKKEVQEYVFRKSIG